MEEWMRGPLALFVAEGLDEVIRQKLLPNDFVDRLRLQFQHRRIHWTRLWSLVDARPFLRRAQPVPPG